MNESEFRTGVIRSPMIANFPPGFLENWSSKRKAGNIKFDKNVDEVFDILDCPGGNNRGRE